MAYIYEYIRTQGYQPLYLEEHCRRLEEAARQLLSLSWHIDCKELRERIATALREGGCSSLVANAVKVSFNSDAEVDITAEELLYNQFSIRALRPRICGIEVVANGSSLLKNCSAKDALLELHRAKNLRHDNPNNSTIWITEQDEVVAIDGAPLIAVFEDETTFSEQGNSVEFELAFNAALTKNLNPRRGKILLSELIRAKELLAIDHRGITAIESWRDHYYMDITASLIATQIAKNEQ